ncbi:MAG: hypothetical protein LZF60_30017 [Nitrospira sp.]|nr:MAG: hypothetical protein LZF60_30017 [Nitrospira sp.]
MSAYELEHDNLDKRATRSGCNPTVSRPQGTPLKQGPEITELPRLCQPPCLVASLNVIYAFDDSDSFSA